jgi:effector-binding domain-containing protein
MRLTENPDTVIWPQTHYIFVEKRGPFPKNAPAAWQEFHQLRPQLQADNVITGFLSLYKMKPQVYRAGVSVAAKPARLPGNLSYEQFPRGKYARFVLTGPYSDLPEATRRVFEIIAEKALTLRDDYHIENYVNDPTNTPEEKLITEILFPVT